VRIGKTFCGITTIISAFFNWERFTGQCGQTRRSVGGFSLTVAEGSVVFVILISSVHLTRVEQCIFSQINVPVYHLSASNL
jgi:hypothetical protein